MGRFSFGTGGKKRTFRAVAGTMMVLAAALIAFGAADTLDSLRSEAGVIRTVHADFVQEKHLKMLAEPLVARGEIDYRAPDALRWEYQSPIRSILLTMGGKTRRFIESDGKLTEADDVGFDAMPVIMQEISNWMRGRFDRNPMFAATLEPHRRIRLVPRDAGMARIIQEIDLFLSNRPGVIDSVVIHESKDSYTRLVFSNTVINKPIPDAVFTKIQ